MFIFAFSSRQYSSKVNSLHIEWVSRYLHSPTILRQLSVIIKWVIDANDLIIFLLRYTRGRGRGRLAGGDRHHGALYQVWTGDTPRGPRGFGGACRGCYPSTRCGGTLQVINHNYSLNSSHSNY